MCRCAVRPEHIATPHITDDSGGHTSEGDQITLTCKVDIDNYVRFKIFWEVPDPSGLEVSFTLLIVSPPKGHSEYLSIDCSTVPLLL